MNILHLESFILSLKHNIRYYHAISSNLRLSASFNNFKQNSTCPADLNKEDTVSWDAAKPFKEIPGPKPLPIIGNNWRFLPVIGEYYGMENNIVNLFQKLQNQYGDVVRLEKILGQDPAVHLYNPDEIEYVYKLESMMPERDILPSISYFRANMRQDLFKDAKGLLTSQGEEWYDFRTKVNPIMMQPKMVKQYVKPVDDISKELIAKIKRKRKTDNMVEMNFLKEVNKWSLESIAFIAVNKKFNCLDDDLKPDSVPFRLINLVEEIFKMTGEIDFKPNLWRYFSTPLYKRAMSLYNEQATLGQKLIEEAKAQIENKSKDDINAEPSVLEKLLKIDPKVAIVMALDMLLVGVDTTSTSLINALYYLSINKEKQNKLRNELSTIFPENQPVLTADRLNSVPYLKACIKEAARIYPVTPGTFRVLSKNIVVSGYQIPKGMIVLFPHMALSINEKHFPKPLEYIPERWLRENYDSDLSYKKAHSFCSMHFGFGSRSCIGRRFAELEMEILLINLVKNFDVSWEGPAPKRYFTTINYLKGPFGFIFNNVN